MKRSLLNIIMAIMVSISFQAISLHAMAAPPVSNKGEAKVEVPKAVVAETVNINTASVEQISASLHGVGPAKAAAIVEFRQKNGPFKALEELQQVKGLGEKTLAKNKASIRFK